MTISSMKTTAPAQKVTAATFAAALVTLAFGLMPADLAILLQFKAEIIVLITFAVGYYVPPAARDVVETP